jgi:hypothetical protein
LRRLLISRGFPSDVRRRFVLAEADVNRVPQEAVGPGGVGDLDDKLRLDPVHTRKNQRRTEPPLRSGGTLRGDVLLVRAPGGAPDRQEP